MKWTLGKRLVRYMSAKHTCGSNCKTFSPNTEHTKVVVVDSQSQSESRLSLLNFDDSSTSVGDKKSEAEDIKTGEQICVPKPQLFSFLHFVKNSSLSVSEQLIHTKHLEALERGDDAYKDPETGYDVYTRLAHLKRGACCGNACRHCPYGHTAVPPDKPKKTYNSAFYV